MRKFSITGLFAIVLIVALAIAVVVLQWTIRRERAAAAIVSSKLAELQTELGYAEITDPSKSYIRRFEDRYSDENEYRFRIHMPDIGQCGIFIFVGELPAAGFPKGQLLENPSPYRGVPGDLILVVTNRPAPDNECTVRTKVQIETDDESYKFWGEQFHAHEERRISRPFGGFTNVIPFGRQPEEFDLAEPFMIVKHYVPNFEGGRNQPVKYGYMIWMERLVSIKAVDTVEPID